MYRLLQRKLDKEERSAVGRSSESLTRKAKCSLVTKPRLDGKTSGSLGEAPGGSSDSKKVQSKGTPESSTDVSIVGNICLRTSLQN